MNSILASYQPFTRNKTEEPSQPIRQNEAVKEYRYRGAWYYKVNGKRFHVQRYQY